MAHIYDYAIIGSGLNGLAVATALGRETKNVVLIESSDFAGGINKSTNFPTGAMNNGIRFVPDTPSAEQALLFLENLLNLKIISNKSEIAPVTYDSSGLKTFLGFGDNPPSFYEELAYFTSNKRIELNLELYMWTKLLLEKFQGEFLPRSYVTKFHKTDDKISHVTINGSKSLYANNFIFCGHVKDLALLLPEETLSYRNKNKLSKNLYWAGLCLDICHSHPITESEAIHVLNGTTQDEIGPCIGRFLKTTEVDGVQLQSSQWMTFIEQEHTEDSENVGLTLKKIKRQIKRAYPTALEDIKIERIMVAPLIAGNGELKLSSNMTIPDLENLWVASGPINPQKNIIGSLLQAELVLASLGFKIESYSQAASIDSSNSAFVEKSDELNISSQEREISI